MDQKQKKTVADIYSIHIETIQSKVIKTLFEVLKEVLLSSVNLVFTPECIELISMGNTGKSIVFLRLLSDQFESYHCESKYIVGFDISQFNKLTKSIQSKDTVTFCMKKETPGLFTIKRVNEISNTEYIQTIKLHDVPYEEIDIPELEYNHSIQLKSSEFQQVCKHLDNLSCNFVSIEHNSNTIFLDCENTFSSSRVSLTSSIESECETGMCVQGKYILQYILLFTKASALDKDFTVFLDSQNPLTLEYSVGSLGCLRFMLQPET